MPTTIHDLIAALSNFDPNSMIAIESGAWGLQLCDRGIEVVEGEVRYSDKRGKVQAVIIRHKEEV